MHRRLLAALLLALPSAIPLACGGSRVEPELSRGPFADAGAPRPAATLEAAAPSEPGAPQAPVASESEAPRGAGAPPERKGPGTTAEAPASGACPSGMQLVDGEYCTDVEQKCLRSWYDKSNKKTVCEEFEPPSRCVGQRVKKRFCIDTYEWPNVKGERPEVMNTFYQAQVKCAAVGKRMCTESEWTLACEGPELKPFPHGFVRDANACNGDHDWDQPNMTLVARRDPTELARLWKGVRSGSQPGCVSDYGVADLPGNTDEVVASEHFESGDFKGKYDSIHTGGPWYRGVRNQCRPKVYTHDEGFYYYFLSFRCCAEPDGAETDPRTPRQRKQGWKFEKVERLAGFSRELVAEKLELKRRGECTCGERDVRCKTLCGTLLGPEARDAVPGNKAANRRRRP